MTDDAHPVPCPPINAPATPVRVRILVAEDEALIRLDLAEMLVESGYEVVGQASNGEQAVALARELRPDLVLMDVKMPVLDGISAAEQIGSIVAVIRSIALEEVLSLGTLDDGALVQWTGIAASASGEIYVLDALDYALKKFDAAGRLLKKTGRQGPGPLELPALLAIQQLPLLSRTATAGMPRFIGTWYSCMRS